MRLSEMTKECNLISSMSQVCPSSGNVQLGIRTRPPCYYLVIKYTCSLYPQSEGVGGACRLWEAVQEALVTPVSTNRTQAHMTICCTRHFWSALSLAYSIPGNVLDAVDEHLTEVEQAINRGPSRPYLVLLTGLPRTPSESVYSLLSYAFIEFATAPDFGTAPSEKTCDKRRRRATSATCNPQRKETTNQLGHRLIR